MRDARAGRGAVVTQGAERGAGPVGWSPVPVPLGEGAPLSPPSIPPAVPGVRWSRSPPFAPSGAAPCPSSTALTHAGAHPATGTACLGPWTPSLRVPGHPSLEVLGHPSLEVPGHPSLGVLGHPSLGASAGAGRGSSTSFLRILRPLPRSPHSFSVHGAGNSVNRGFGNSHRGLRWPRVELRRADSLHGRSCPSCLSHCLFSGHSVPHWRGSHRCPRARRVPQSPGCSGSSAQVPLLRFPCSGSSAGHPGLAVPRSRPRLPGTAPILELALRV